MADIKFACPHCAQHITCNELWGGHQLDCPSCKQPITVPAKVVPRATNPAATTPQSLVPKPPEQAEPRLSINAGHAAGGGAEAAAPQRPAVPIRNLAPPKPKKKSALVQAVIIVAVLAVLGVGGYYGYGYLKGMQNGVNEVSKEAAKNANSGQVGHIANLYSVLDATDPSKAPVDRRSTGPRQRRSGVGQEINLPAGADGAAAAAANDTTPLIPAVWTLDITQAKIPSGRANGAISGTNFVPDNARVDPVGRAEVLRLVQGQPVSPDREMMVYLHLKPGEKIGGQTLNIAKDMAGSGVPQVTKRWKTNPRYAPQYKSFTSGYAMRLELGEVADGVLPGKIYLALPDLEQSVVAGSFKATITTNAPVETTVQATPVMAQPSASPNADAAWEARYGTKRAR